MQKTVVYILSEKHSGSTWVAYVLGSHTNSANLGEYYRPFINKNQAECDICKALNKLPCKILHGIHNIPIPKAYDFAFGRYRKDILVDSGKEITWIDKIHSLKKPGNKMIHYIKHPGEVISTIRNTGKTKTYDYDIKFLHLIRDPRGWYASEKRRERGDVKQLMERWVESNRNMIQLSVKTGIPILTVSYDHLAVKPERYFPQVCKYIGMGFQESALEYWNFEHHCPGGTNGAGYNVLKKYQSSHGVTTADDEYYEKNLNTKFYDQRWKQQLEKEELDYINNNTKVGDLIAEVKIDFNEMDLLLDS